MSSDPATPTGSQAPSNKSDNQQEPRLPPLLPPKLEQRGIFRLFFFAVFVFLLYQLLLIMSLFSSAIIWAVALSIVFAPLYRAIQRRIPGGRNRVAAITTFTVLLVFMVPLISIFWVVLQQSAQVYPTVASWFVELRNGESFVDLLPTFMQQWWDQIAMYVDENPYLAQFDLEQFMLSNVETLSRSMANFGAAAARGFLFGFVNLILVLVLMYFCFLDGEGLLSWFYQIVPMPGAHVEAIAHRVYQTINAVITGAVMTAGVQGLLAIIGYLVAGVPLAMFFGVLTGFSAMIPIGGAALVWIPITIFMFTDSQSWGIFLAFWGLLVVSGIDNFLKPILIGNQARMPILLVFCAIIGGLNVYGFTGVIIGPILVAMLLAFISIYRDYYLPGYDRKQAPSEPAQAPLTPQP